MAKLLWENKFFDIFLTNLGNLNFQIQLQELWEEEMLEHGWSELKLNIC